MKENFIKKVNEEINLIKDELLNLGFKEEDNAAVSKKINEENIYFVIYPSFLSYNQKKEVWYAVRFKLKNEENLKHYEFTDKKIDLLNKIKDLFNKCKYKFFYDEDAVCRMFSHPEPDNHGYFEYKGYVNPSIPEGASHNHALG